MHLTRGRTIAEQLALALIIVYGTLGPNSEPCYAQPSPGMQELGTLGGTESFANAITLDGTTVVGWHETPPGVYVPFYGT
jgi:hypothetical protein